MKNILLVRTVPHRHGESTTWLELFFDLVYVALLVELGDRLSHDFSLHGVIEFALLFVPIWWSWIGLMLYTRRFPADDIGQRLLTIAYMGVMALMAFNIHDVTGSTAVGFLLAYALSKVVLVLMYSKAWLQFPAYRTIAAYHIGVYTVAAMVWLLIAILDPLNYWLWVAATAITVLAPFYLPWLRRLGGHADVAQPPVKAYYMVDRFGELTIIVLGEFFIKIVTSAHEREFSWVTPIYFASLLSISASLWWLYFDHLDHSALASLPQRMKGWVYTHYPLLLAITAYGVVGKKVLALTPGEALSDEKRWILCTALALALVSIALVEHIAKEVPEAMSRPPQVLVRLVGAVVLLALAAFGGGLSPVVLIPLVAITLIAMVVIDISARMSNPTETDAEHIPTPNHGLVDGIVP
jgi:low temperature requirement protein LtrA